MKICGALLLAGLLGGCADPVMQQYEAQQKQDLLSRQLYLVAHPDLNKMDKWSLENGIETPAQIEAGRVARAAIIKQQQEGRQKYVDAHPGLSGEFREAILAGKILVGMNSTEVLASWQTDRWSLVQSTDYGNTSISDWKLDSTYVTFTGGTVSSISFFPQ